MKKRSSTPNKAPNNVIDILTKKNIKQENNQIIRLASEHDGINILYSNDANPGKAFGLKVLCWVLLKNGTIDAMVPWLNKIVLAHELSDPLNGHWKGYYNPQSNRFYSAPPQYKKVELESAAIHYPIDREAPSKVYQEIPDTIGTHAMLTNHNNQSINLTNIISWQLLNSGKVQAMATNQTNPSMTPVLPGDKNLSPIQDSPNFHYFFQHEIANKLKYGNIHILKQLAQLLHNNKK